MRKHRFDVARLLAASIILCSSVLGSAHPTLAANFFEFSKSLYDGLDTLANLLDEVRNVEGDLNNIKSTKTKPPNNEDWKKVIDSYHAVAKSISEGTFRIEFNAEKYPIPKDIRLCVNRVVAVETLKNYQRDIKEGISAIAAMDMKLVATTEKVNLTNKSLQKIQDLYLELSGLTEGVDILRSYFQLTALDIPTKVMPALATVRNAIETKRKLIAQQTKLAETKLSNLTGNLSDLMSSECDMSGVYRWYYGDVEQPPSPIKLSKSGASYTCASSSSCPCSIAEASSLRGILYLRQTCGGKILGWNFTISQDFRTMTYKGSRLVRQ
jgi:hypothetical protein